MAKLSFLEVVGIALFTNVIMWQATSSYSLGPHSSIVTQETFTTTTGTPSGIPYQYTTTMTSTQETTTTTGTGSNGCESMTCAVGEYCDLNGDNRPACFCNDVCYLLYDPVCGSDGQTYSNDCFLGMEACKTNTTITILYRSGCGDAPSTFPSTYTTQPTEESPTTTGTGSTCNGTTCPPGKPCPRFCPAIYDPVCGSDGKTYSNGCALQVEACTTSTSITVQHNGSCDDAPPTFPSTYTTPPTKETPTTTGTGSTCNGTTCPPGKPCPRFCPAIYDPVCGSDGKTYSSVCSLQVQACTTSTSITVQRNGSCDDGCTGFECLFHGQCSSDEYNNPTCVCVLGCAKIYRPVCGSNSQTYSNECELERYSCQTQISINVLHPGQCDGDSNDCDNGTCPLSFIEVCGSDNQTYAGECELGKVACQTNTNITVLHPGQCYQATVTTSTPANRRTKKPGCRKNKKDRRHRKDGL